MKDVKKSLKKPAIIIASELSKIYLEDRVETKVLSGVSLRLRVGESLSIVGRSGSGKSTLMHILAGLDRPTNGHVVLNEQNLSSLDQQQLDRFRGQNVGFIFQSFYLQPKRTVLQNVAVPLEVTGVNKNKRMARASEVLARLELTDVQNQAAGTLSGGQKQRTVIARALVGDPAVIFADEPTGNLDSETGAIVENLLLELAEAGKSVVVVTHDTSFAKRFKNRLVLSDGKVVSLKGKGVL